MRLLADESVDMLVIRALRAADHDVRSIAEDTPGASDEDVAQIAVAEDRLLVTEDRDFGRLVYADQRGSRGVVYLRYPAGSRLAEARDIVQLIAAEGSALSDSFVVMQPGRVRIGRLPNPEGQKE